MKESLGFGPFSSQICSRDKAKRNELSTSFLFCVYTAISIKVVPEQSGKVEYEREKLAGSDD